MSKYCMQCGKEIDDNANNCEFCGSPQNYSIENSPVQKKKDPVVAIVAIVSVILVVLIVFANLTIFNNEYKKPIDSLIRMVETGDSDYVEDVFPEYMFDEASSEKLDETAEQITEMFKLHYGDDFEISYDIIDKSDIDDDKLEDLEKSIKKNFDEKVNVSKGYNVELELTIEADSKSNSNAVKCNVYKIDGDWCMIENDMF